MTGEHNVCTNQQQLDLVREDLITVKTALGYKEKSNGAFRAEVEEADKNLSERLHTVETEVIQIGTTLNSIKWIMAIIMPVFAAILIEILIKL